jgi:chemotaxis protein histidine kinase CheA
VEIECAGEVRLDPRRWAPLWAELVHVVRNAVDHGFETQEERRALAKGPQPRLRLAATLGDGQLTVEIEDDGRGIDWPALERAARERGVAVGGDRLDLVLAPGVSSRAQVSTTSGRGVGMAAVAARVRAFEGTLSVTSDPGRGTCWKFSFPLAAETPVAA